MLTQEQLNKIAEYSRKTVDEKLELVEQVEEVTTKMEETHKDSIPFIVHNPEQLVAVGDANNTQVKIADYEISFRRPTELIPEGIETTPDKNGYSRFTMKFEDVYITPRQNLPLMEKLIKLYAFRDKFKELKDGSNFEITPDTNKEDTVEQMQELLEILTAESCLLLDVMYEVLALLLGIPKKLTQDMESRSVLFNFMTLIQNNPGIFNETETFFA